MINFVICEVDQAKWVAYVRHSVCIKDQYWTTDKVQDEIIIPPVVIRSRIIMYYS
jgi:hypothetical protein